MKNKEWKSYTVLNFISRGEAELKTGPFGTQLHASDYVETGIPVINVRNIGFGNIKEGKLEFISEETAQRLASHLLEANDIVFGRKGAVERHAFIKQRYVKWFQGSDCLRIRWKSPSVDPRFISYCLLTETHQRWMINQCSHGSTMASLNQDIIARIPLHLPPLPIQRQIASILSAYDDLIENNTRRIAILEQMARILYEEWFVKFRFPGHEQVKMVESELGMIPEGWRIVQLGDIAQEVRRSVNPESIDPETPYLGLEHLPRRSIALTNWDIAQTIQSTKLIFKKGEILFGKIRPYLHKVGIAPLDGVCSSDTIVINSKEEQYKALVLNCVSSDHFVAFASKTSQGTQMPRANWNVLATFPIVIPSDHVLSLFNNFVRSAVDSFPNLIFRNRNLRRTRDHLLPKLISGEIDVSSWVDGGVEVEEPVAVMAQGRREVREEVPASPTPIDVNSLEQRSLWG